LKILLQKKFGAKSHGISVISAAGNRNFSPYLNMIKAWASAKIPHLVVTDFDSLTKETDRAILVGAKAASYPLNGELAFHAKVDAVIDKDEAAYSGVAKDSSIFFNSAGVNVFVFTSDLEYALVTAKNKTATAEILSSVATSDTDYNTGFSLDSIRKLIGSKSIPISGTDKPQFKKPYIHEKIARTIDLNHAHDDIGRLLDAIAAL
jgi:hypothetical protein